MLSDSDKRSIVEQRIRQIEASIFDAEINAKVLKKIGDDTKGIVEQLKRLQKMLEFTKEELDAIPEGGADE
jgi:hypothetical protein